MPECFWTFAAPYYCLMESLTYDSQGRRLYDQWAGCAFEAQIIPFGALIEYIPPETRSKEQPGKWGPTSVPGIFGGYELGEKGVWNKKYLIWNLRDFESVNLAADVYASNIKLGEPNRVFTVRVSKEEWEFPLRAEYVRKNRTLAGIREKDDDPTGARQKEILDADEELARLRAQEA